MRNVEFRKSGKEIKAAVTNRRVQLRQRLDQRNKALDLFLKDPAKVRSYLVRSTQPNYLHSDQGHVLYSKDDISSEERQEIDQLCQRVFEIEHELHRLAYVTTHLDDDQIFDLSFDELLEYGFEPSA